MRTPSRVLAAATVLSGLLLSSACANDSVDAAATTPTSAAPLPSSAAPSPSSAAPKPSATTSSPAAGGGSNTGGGGVFSGTRQIYLLPKNSEATLGVVQDGKIGLSEKFGDAELFVLTAAKPGGDQYLIRTAKLRKGGEPLCLSAKLGAGGKPAAVLTTACDAAAADQLFRFRKTGTSNGKPTYTIRTGTDTYVIQDPTGEIASTGTGVAAITIGEGTPDIDTPFVLADKGAASLPALD
ncbi:hypothetical protein BJ973_007351 [Actinoplanes tereljensis]|uniref:hypothetical protein n=1 Tax=Paractinoplanes tereljensis TaxID=571912 RepID=UPI00194408B4|nr:hypothetical protein [Actinoplanes tereljensis]